MSLSKKGKPSSAGRKKEAARRRKLLLIFAVPVFLIILLAIYIEKPIQEKIKMNSEVPEQYIPIYKAAEKEYGVPWYLLAAHHRVETIFSTMDPMLSPAGAEGPMQFMPCTFVGWSHESCEGLGKGNIPENEKTDPAVIKKYGGYGVDANGDGIADPFDLEDAIFSAANYLSKNGAADGELRKAVFAYNHSNKYVDDVLYYAQVYKEEEEKQRAAAAEK